ncbi:MAG: peptidoglycan DD-metalloendopeptidase family protein [Saprospiraceae bacterium]|nr:peptidoglycan DD-metalloendopeptidase family protein [Saprospiraceae bacterium]
MEKSTFQLPGTTFPVLGEHLQPEDYCPLDLSIHNPHFQTTNVTTYEGLDAYVQSVLQQNHAKVGYGGYGEHRIFYEQSPLFNDGTKPPRCIHLGLDLWSPAGTPVYAPLDARVHSFRYNDQMLDYGATIILEHIIENTTFYTLYGHLSLASLENLYQGKFIAKGQKFAAFGNRDENGGWVPHLHFQVILDMEGREGDFPGVATQAEASYFLNLCPDPLLFLPFLLQKV